MCLYCMSLTCRAWDESKENGGMCVCVCVCERETERERAQYRVQIRCGRVYFHCLCGKLRLEYWCATSHRCHEQIRCGRVYFGSWVRLGAVQHVCEFCLGHMGHDSFIYMYRTSDSFIYIYTCVWGTWDTTHLYIYIYRTSLAYVCDMTHLYIYIYIWDMPRVRVWHDSFTRLTCPFTPTYIYTCLPKPLR